MRTAAIVHQQICQLKWHLLACLGLIMVLTIEEAIVSLRAGGGLYSDRMAVAALSFSPLLAGLIACANIQADLSEKRYIFWRSKPANLKLLMVSKFFTGLLAFFVIAACPVIFSLVTCAVVSESFFNNTFLRYYISFLSLVGAMAYSLCFGCNVLVRNTARSWLVGMFLAGLVLVAPFMLPLGLTDIVDVAFFATEVGGWVIGLYPAIMIVVSIAAFLCALYAAQHDWHLKTNLKGLLCVGAGFVLILLMLFTRQVANIRVLDEKVIGGSGTFDKVGSRVMLQGEGYVSVGKKGISLQKVGSDDSVAAFYPRYGNIGIDSNGNEVVYGPRVEGCRVRSYPVFPQALFMATEEGTYYFGIISYYRREGELNRQKNTYEKVYLRSYKLIGDSWKVISELDISDCLTDRKHYITMAMRLIEETLVACINRSFLTVDVTKPHELRVIDKKLDVIRPGVRWLRGVNRRREFAIPSLPIDGIGTEERIRLSIDLADRYVWSDDHLYDSSIVDIDDGKIACFAVSHEDVARFDVIKWDDEKIYCRFGVARPFTALEALVRPLGSPNDRIFVQDHKLYLLEGQQLMVFDIRSDRRIRKLGHFTRMDCNLEDVAVVDDDGLLLCAWLHSGVGGKGTDSGQRHLYLLENPK